MAITARTVRWVLLASALTLVAVILGFVGYAHYRARHFLRTLPARLGVDIRQETNGFTYSQSVAGRTVFTVHASREIQRVDGRVTLHDVDITLYGRTPDSVDRIRGSDFEFDPASGILRATGDVYLDLEAPGGNLATQPHASAGDRMVHVKTSGLTFLEKERTADTDQPIEFMAGDLKGRAVGASYDSAHGFVVLKSDVQVNGVRDGRPMKLTAARAELDRNSNVVRLTSAVASEASEKGLQRLSAENSVVHLSDQGAPQKLEAQGHVLLSQDGRGTLAGERLQVDFGENATQKSALRHARLSGQVSFHDDANGTMQQAQAAELNVVFDGNGRARQADLNGGVSLETKSAASQRVIIASRAQLGFQTLAGGRSILHSAEAFGDSGLPARFRLSSAQPKGAGFTNTNLAADHLQAQFAAVNGTSQLHALNGEGHTTLEQTSMDLRGAELIHEASAGDSLHADLTYGSNRRIVLTRAEQHGHVTASRNVAAHVVKGKHVAAEADRARADAMSFDAQDDRFRLSGGAEVADASSALYADQVTVDRTSGDATAIGSVRVSYQQPDGKGEALHVTASRAESSKTSGLTKFFGSGNSVRTGGARLWQGGSQVDAPEIVFDRTRRQVIATGNGGLVHAVLPGPGSGSSLVRVASHTLTYSDITHQVELDGSVQVAQGDARLQSATATVFLAAASLPSNSPIQSNVSETSALMRGPQGLLNGRVERLVADGGVDLNQPGRRAAGTRLVYTLVDQTYVLTGTKAAPPRLMDESRGAITGVALRFRGSDDSVEILGGEGQRVQSQTHLKQH